MNYNNDNNNNNGNIINMGGYTDNSKGGPFPQGTPFAQPVQPAQTAQAHAITSIAELQSYANGQIVALPPFAEGQPFYARLKRPSLLGLVKSGKIPNELLAKANALFVSDNSGFDPDEKDMMSQMFDVLYVLAKETLVEPSMDELSAAGISLTDEQLMFLFSYGQQGVRALGNFRTE